MPPISNAYSFRMPFGFAGDITRASTSVGSVETQAFNASLPFASFGIPGKIASGLFVPLAVVGDVTPYGFLVRPYPITGLNASDPLGTAVPNCTAGQEANVLRRGYINAACNAGVAALGGVVYVRYANPSGVLVVGGLEATSVGGSNVALTNAVWMGPADTNGVAEIAFNI